MAHLDPLLTPADVGERIQKPVKTLAQWRSLGRGPRYLKLENHSVRYRESDVEAWLAAGEQTVRRAG